MLLILVLLRSFCEDLFGYQEFSNDFRLSVSEILVRMFSVSYLPQFNLGTKWRQQGSLAK